MNRKFRGADLADVRFGEGFRAFEGGLQFGFILLHGRVAGVPRHIDVAADAKKGAREGPGNLESVPRVEHPGTVEGNMKPGHGRSSETGKHHWTGFDDVARAARPVNGEGGVPTLVHFALEAEQGADRAFAA